MARGIVYPGPLQKGQTIAVVAPSAGVTEGLFAAMDQAKVNLEGLGYAVVEGTVRTNEKLVSASRKVRAEELQRALLDSEVGLVFPVWGGELLMEILPELDWKRLKEAKPKWVLGYSDVSTFLFAYTLLTGRATAHGTNYLDLSALRVDPTTERWLDVVIAVEGDVIEQESSELYQSRWDRDRVKGYVLDTKTEWKVLGERDDVEFSGRLIGGCLETIFALNGTRFAPVREFVEEYCREDGVVWYLESTDSNAADVYRKLWMLRESGWFERVNGVVFGRPDNYRDSGDFVWEDALGIFAEMGVVVVYDADIGHVPPQVTLVNGAVAKVSVSGGRGRVVMELR